MFIAIPEYLKENVTDVSPGHWRVQACILKINMSNILILNTYYPCDPKTLRFDDSELLEVFDSIDKILEKNEFHQLVWGGDINCDFSRRTGFVESVDRYVTELQLVKSWDRFDVDFTHVFEVEENTYVSKIDHFFWNEGLDEKVSDGGVIHMVDNNSDHSVIYCVVEVGNCDSSISDSSRGVPKPNWKKSTEDQRSNYKRVIERKLEGVEIPESFTSCSRCSL